MTNKEVIEQLKLTLDYCMRADPDAYHEMGALQHAVRCVELMPEMVEALHKTNNLMFNLDNDWSYDEQYKANESIINRAKEMSADEE